MTSETVEEDMRITLTLEGADEEIKPVLQFLATTMETGARQAQKPSVEGQSEEGRQQETSWTEGKIRYVWRGLTYPCRSILEALAKHEEGVGWDAFVHSLGLKPNQVGGRLSSLGHQMRKQGYQNLPNPIRFCMKNEVLTYELDPLWRQTIREIRAEIDAVGAGESEADETGQQ